MVITSTSLVVSGKAEIMTRKKICLQLHHSTSYNQRTTHFRTYSHITWVSWHFKSPANWLLLKNLSRISAKKTSNGDNIPRLSDHYPLYPETFNKESYFADIVGNLEKNFFFIKFPALFAHRRVMGTKMNRGQETLPKKLNARYEMNWAGHQAVNIDTRNREMNRG